MTARTRQEAGGGAPECQGAAEGPPGAEEPGELDHRSLDTWRTARFASAWAANDVLGDFLALPRAMAASLVAADRPDARTVVDVGSGPGSFLAAFLDALPDAQGLWTDGSEAMLAQARRRLEPYGDRVEYRLVDMGALAEAPLPSGVDAVISSRALHHLGVEGLGPFYAAGARLLAPGGWLANLDHVAHRGAWERRLRDLRDHLVPRTDGSSAHPHVHPLPTLDEHLAAMEAAGISDVELAWKSFFTCLVMGRAPG